jgi:hypothetical protein
MIQLSILAETGRSGLDEVVASLVAEVQAAGASQEAALYASRAVLRRFAADLEGLPLGARQVARVRSYFLAVLRKVIYRRSAREDQRYRERARVLAAVTDLASAGIRGDALRGELIDTLRFEPELVDAILGRSVSVA